MAKGISPVEALQALNSAARDGTLDVPGFLERNYMLEGSTFLRRKPIKFEPWQTEHVLRPVFNRVEFDRDTFLIGVPKKNGKSTLAACVAVYALLLDDFFPEVYSTAGDKDQAHIIFDLTRKGFERSPGLRPFVKIYRDALERIDGNGVYRALASDASGSHGSNPSCVIWDEIWNQSSYALWEALTLSPARENPFQFITTYAGYQARTGNLLWDLYSRALSASDKRMYMFWRSGADANVASWVTSQYLESQRRRLPEHIYRRLHRNEWSVAEGAKVFRVPAECWQGAFEDRAPAARYAAGIDLAKFRDFTAWMILRTDVEPRRVVEMGTLPQGIDYTQQVEILAATLERFGNPRALVDAGNAGTAVLEMMRKRGLNVSEFTFTNDSKAELVTALAVAFEQRLVVLPGSGRTLEEARAIQNLEVEIFNFEPTVLASGRIRYEAAGAYHDDTIMALCLALKASSGVSKREPLIEFLSTEEPDRSRWNDPSWAGPERLWTKF